MNTNQKSKLMQTSRGKLPQPDSPEAALRQTVDYLYSLSDDCPEPLRQPIGMLRQLINEEFVGKNKQVSSQFIWDILKKAKLSEYYTNKFLECLPPTLPYGKDTPDEYTEQWHDGFNAALGQIRRTAIKNLNKEE